MGNKAVPPAGGCLYYVGPKKEEKREVIVDPERRRQVFRACCQIELRKKPHSEPVLLAGDCEGCGGLGKSGAVSLTFPGGSGRSPQ
mgnify:CR=1 FL=1